MTQPMTRKDLEVTAGWILHENRMRPEKLNRILLRLTTLTPTLKARLAGEQNWRCCYCGERMSDRPGGHDPHFATFEHVICRGDGGPDDDWNLVIACCCCNEERGRTYRPEHHEALEHMLDMTGLDIRLPLTDIDPA